MTEHAPAGAAWRHSADYIGYTLYPISLQPATWRQWLSTQHGRGMQRAPERGLGFRARADGSQTQLLDGQVFCLAGRQFSLASSPAASDLAQIWSRRSASARERGGGRYLLPKTPLAPRRAGFSAPGARQSAAPTHLSGTGRGGSTALLRTPRPCPPNRRVNLSSQKAQRPCFDGLTSSYCACAPL